ncbi:MAG TPA: AMP-binding protein [Acidimicrobiales bacterium]|nr:AMP-binding protein [Acidimicrobiales bacterium]
MKDLLAIDLPLGVELERALRECAESGEAFCVLDQRLSPRRRDEELSLLGATSILGEDGRGTRREGQLVEDEVGLVMLTSGSSGVPKAAELSWTALRASADLTQSTLRGDTAPVWFPCLPANHIGGLAVLLRAIVSDASLCWSPTTPLDDAPRLGATHVALVRTQLARHDVSGYFRVLLGGARPPGDLPSNVVTTWGMTETGSGIVYDGVALPGVDVASVEGELIVRSPTLFRSYRTMARPSIVGPDGRADWFPTGDGGDVLDGRVRVRGRLGFVITTGGEKLWPEDLEAVISTLAQVRDVAVTSEFDGEWGERVVALVVGDGANHDAEIMALANDRIGPWAKPKEIRYVAAIPRTVNGKIRRQELRYLQ